MSLWAKALERIEAGEVCALVTIVAVQGSAPREAGAAMLVWRDGQVGTIGGGNLEFRLAAQARAMLAAGKACAVQDYPLGPLLAQCCGGRVRALLERLDGSRRIFLEAARGMEAAGHTYLVETAVEGGAIRKAVLEACGEESANGIALFDSMGRPLDCGAAPRDFTMMQIVRPDRPRLVMFGAGHVGQAVARVVSTLPLVLQWLDTREEYRGMAVAGVKAAFAADPAAAVAAAGQDSLYLIFTHSHALDYTLVRAILARGDFRYCGVIGSKTKRARFAHRLQADGTAPETIARLVCPIGALLQRSGLKSKAPEAVAVAVAAELLMALEQERTAALRVRHDS